MEEGRVRVRVGTKEVAVERTLDGWQDCSQGHIHVFGKWAERLLKQQEEQAAC